MDSSLEIRKTLENLIRQECRQQGFEHVPKCVMEKMLSDHNKVGDKALLSVSAYFEEHKLHKVELAENRARREAKFVTNLKTGTVIDVRKIELIPLPKEYPQSDDGDLALSILGELLEGTSVADAITPLLANIDMLSKHLSSGKRLWLIGKILKNNNQRNVVPVIFWQENVSYEATNVFVETGPGEQYGKPSGYHIGKLKKSDQSAPAWRLEYLPFTPLQ